MRKNELMEHDYVRVYYVHLKVQMTFALQILPKADDRAKNV